MNRYFFHIIIASLITMGFVSCETDQSVPDTSDIEVAYTIFRFDDDLMSIDTNSFEAEIEELRATYADFYELYFGKLLPLRDESEEVFQASLKGFVSASEIRNLKDTIDIVFGDFSDEAAQIDQAYKLLSYYLVIDTFPDIYTMLTEYSFQLVEARAKSKDIICVGLDMFLGDNFPYTQLDPQNPAFSQYLVRRFNKDHLVKKTMELVIDQYLGGAPGDRMLDIMIHNGKRLYLLDKILPDAPDTVIMEYTKEQMEWVEENQLEMWAFFFKQELFYKTNRMEINKYLNVSPQSPGMPVEAPGRTANYMGWKIIEAYMKRYPETSMTELIQLRDAQKILDRSRFKPRK